MCYSTCLYARAYACTITYSLQLVVRSESRRISYSMVSFRDCVKPYEYCTVDEICRKTQRANDPESMSNEPQAASLPASSRQSPPRAAQATRSNPVSTRAPSATSVLSPLEAEGESSSARQKSQGRRAGLEVTSSRTLAHLHHPLTLMRNGHPRRLAPSSGTSTPRSYAPLPSSRLVKLSCDIMAAGAAIPAPTATHRATAEGSSGAVEAQLTSKADVKLQPVIPPTPLSARSAKNDADAARLRAEAATRAAEAATSAAEGKATRAQELGRPSARVSDADRKKAMRAAAREALTAAKVAEAALEVADRLATAARFAEIAADMCALNLKKSQAPAPRRDPQRIIDRLSRVQETSVCAA